MARFVLCLVFIFSYFSLWADELDQLINSAMDHSLYSRSFSNLQLTARSVNNSPWYDLVPDVSISAGCNIDNNSTNGSFSAGLNISKGFEDVDAAILSFRKADIKSGLLLNKTILDKQDFIDKLIQTYNSICISRQKTVLIEQQIKSYQELNELISKNKDSNSILVLEQISNEIDLSRNELEIEQLNMQNNSDNLSEITGVDLSKLKFIPVFPAKEPVNTENQYFYKISSQNLELSNNILATGKQNRELYFPTVSVSANAGYDLFNQKWNYGAGASISYPILEIFNRLNTIKQLHLENETLLLEISNSYKEMASMERLMDREIRTLQKKSNYQIRNSFLERQIQTEYLSEYEKGDIDAYQLKQRMNMLYNSRLDAVDTGNKLYLLLKRRQYGILRFS